MAEKQGKGFTITRVKHATKYCYAFPTAFGTGAVLFQNGAFPVKRIFLPGLNQGNMKKGMGNSVFLRTKPPKTVLDLSRNIRAFFKGNPMKTPWELLDLRNLTLLQQTVLRTVATIPHGKTQTYGHIAALIGRPKASRFVGTTLRKNPFPVAIPCHRVIRADGSPGAFAGSVQGTPLKKRMITLEKHQC